MSEKLLNIDEVIFNGEAVDPDTLIASQALAEHLEPAAQFLKDNYRDVGWLIEELEDVVASAACSEVISGLKPVREALEVPRVHPMFLPQTFWSSEEVADEPEPGFDTTDACEKEAELGPERDPYDDLYLATEKLELAEKFGKAAGRCMNAAFRKDLRDAADVLLFDAMQLINPRAQRVVDDEEG